MKNAEKLKFITNFNTQSGFTRCGKKSLQRLNSNQYSHEARKGLCMRAPLSYK